MRGFNFSIFTPRSWFCPVPSWHHLLFGIRFYYFVFFIRSWKIKSRCLSVWFQHITCYFLPGVYSWCIVVFIDNVRTRNDEFISLRRSKKKNLVSSLEISISVVVYRMKREIGTNAFSPGTSCDGAWGNSHCCDFGSLLLKDYF